MRRPTKLFHWIFFGVFVVPQAVLLALKITGIVEWGWLIIIAPAILFDAIFILIVLAFMADRLQKHIHR